MADRMAILEKIKGTTVSFKLNAGDGDKLFGTVTTNDISKSLSKLGFEVDRKDIKLAEPIKFLGTHKATVSYGEGLETHIQIAVERG